jgi:hypothetical protein
MYTITVHLARVVGGAAKAVPASVESRLSRTTNLRNKWIGLRMTASIGLHRFVQSESMQTHSGNVP